MSVHPIKRGRTGKLQGQIMDERHGNPKKKKTVTSGKCRKYLRTPQPPRHLPKEGKKYWKEHAPGYVASNRLNRDTRELFLQLCVIWSRWMEFQAQEGIRIKSGTGIVVKGKVSKSALNSQKEETHYFRCVKQFIDISEQFEEKKATGHFGWKGVV